MNALVKAIETVAAESGGLLELRVIRRTDTLSLILAALEGDQAAAQTMQGVTSFLRSIRAAPKHKPALCATCPEPLQRKSFSVVLAYPDREDPSAAIGVGICSMCATETSEIKTKALQTFREIWPDARDVTIQLGGSA